MTDNREYYDAFSAGYDRNRDHGYHKLIDDQAAALVRRVGEGKDLLEVGCGTGLVLQRVSAFARTAKGIDLSPGMLQRARDRGLDVREGSATALPFADDTFDVAYSFKVLSHVPQLDVALSEMVRVVRPGGHLVFDIYNRHSLRYLIKRVFGPRSTSKQFDEHAISTAFMTPDEVVALLPTNARVTDIAGIRVITPHPAVFSLPVFGKAVEAAEWALMDSAARRFAGFSVFFVEKRA
jgi:ubiquinone/menaquinone biosynthesis C-methylase UbiE